MGERGSTLDDDATGAGAADTAAMTSAEAAREDAKRICAEMKFCCYVLAEAMCGGRWTRIWTSWGRVARRGRRKTFDITAPRRAVIDSLEINPRLDCDVLCRL